jgi:hypothetical protein
MLVKLHANATTTPRTRAYIQASTASVAELAAELGVHEKLVPAKAGNHPPLAEPRRHRRPLAPAAPHGHQPPSARGQALSPFEALVCELRTLEQLPLDDLTEAMRRCVNPKLSRSAIHRCLKRHGISRLPKPDKPGKPKTGRFEEAGVGFIHACPSRRRGST